MLDTAFALGKITPLDNNFSDEFLNLLSESDFMKLVSAFGCDRILFGTDSPWTDQKESLKAIEKLPLSQNDLQNILYNNAKKILDL